MKVFNLIMLFCLMICLSGCSQYHRYVIRTSREYEERFLMERKLPDSELVVKRFFDKQVKKGNIRNLRENSISIDSSVYYFSTSKNSSLNITPLVNYQKWVTGNDSTKNWVLNIIRIDPGKDSLFMMRGARIFIKNAKKINLFVYGTKEYIQSGN